MTNVIAAFSLEQASRLSGLSVARLIDWDRSGFFEPAYAYEHRSSPLSRIYSFDDLVGLRALCLLRNQVSMQHLRKAAVELKQHSGRPWSELTLYVLNREVHFKNPSSGQVVGATSGQLAMPIALGDVADTVAKDAERLRQRDPDTFGKTARSRHVMNGALCVAGTRIPVSTVKRLHEAGRSAKQIMVAYPTLRPEDIAAAIEAEEKLTQAA